jgi:hypothetical protein
LERAGVCQPEGYSIIPPLGRPVVASERKRAGESRGR